jgi:hypothetical protein
MANFDHPPIRPRAFIRVMFVGILAQAAYLLFGVCLLAILAPGGKVTDESGIREPFGEEPVGQIENLLELAIPRHQTGRFIEHRDTIAHVFERDAQLGLT